MLSKKKEDRIKSAQSNSPYGRKSKEGTTGGAINDGKQVKINIWPEWSEVDVNNEKWDVTTKAKEKDKTKSPQMVQSMFDDPDGRVKLPPSLKATKWKRCSEYFNKNPVIVDTETGIHKFDIFSLNEHLFSSETMRWIICQINNLWMTSEKKCLVDSEIQNQETNYVGPDGTYHTWRFWEHIYAINKVGKGFPLYNPAGKYIVKLFWMGEWRKILVDDNLPFDQNDQLLLPVTSLKNELWPVILSKALLKIASLSYGFATNETEFGDFSVIHSLTGWIPQKKIVSKEHQNVILDDLQKLLPHWIYPDGNPPAVNFEKPESSSMENQHLEVNPEKTEIKDINPKDKGKKEMKENKPKEKKEKEKEKSKTEKFQEGKFVNENPETLIFASYTSTYNKSNMVSTSKMADYSESLRKIGIPQIYSHPVLLNYYRDCPLVKCDSTDTVPRWKLIRPLTKQGLPLASDCIIHDSHLPNTEDTGEMAKFVEIQSIFLNHKISNNLSKSPIEHIEEDLTDKTEILVSSSYKDDAEIQKELNAASSGSNANVSQQKVSRSIVDISNEEETTGLNPPEDKTDFNNEITKSWIDLSSFFDCFQVIYVYHKTETYRYTENFSDIKSTNVDQKEPMYLFVDNIESTEIIFCLSALCKWFSVYDMSYCPDNQITRSSPTAANTKDTINTYDANTENLDNMGNEPMKGMFIAESHSWTSFKIGKCFKRTQTNGTKAISLKFPPGRHCLRIFIQSCHGFHCKLISQKQFQFGTEDDIMRLSVENPKRIANLAANLISSFINIITSFSNMEERKLNERTFIDLVLGFNKGQKFKISFSEFMQVFNQSVLKTISKINKDIINSDTLFALRVLNLDFGHSVIDLNSINKQVVNSNRNSAKAPVNATKVDNRKQSSTKSMANVDVKADDKKIDFVREYSASNISQIVLLQNLVRGFYVRKIINARNFESKFHSRIVNELNRILPLIEQNSPEIGISILNDLIEKYPKLLEYYELENDKINHISLQEFTGSSNIIIGNGFGMLFREVFHINASRNNSGGIFIKINCNTPRCGLLIINNDNGESYSENILKRLHLSNLRPNFNGYTLMACVKEVESTVNWRVKVICDGNSTPPTFSKQELCSDFSVSKIRDYYIPDENGVLFQQMIKVKNDHLSSFFVKLSNPDIPVKLAVFNFDEEIYSIEGKGEAFIPSFIFLKDQFVDDRTEISVRSPSRNSNKSKKNKDKAERNSVKNSRTNSSCSTDDNRINKYSIQAFVNVSKWVLTKVNEEFVENLKKSRRKDFGENKIINESPSKLVQNTESTKKEANQKQTQKNKGKDKGQENTKTSKVFDKNIKGASGENASRPNSTNFEHDKANWSLVIVSDASSEDNIQIFKNNEKYESLLSTKKIWLELDPSRFEKGKKLQTTFNEENQTLMNDAEGQIQIQRTTLPLDPGMGLHESTPDSSQTRLNAIKSSRKQQIEWNSWCQTEKECRTKKIIETLNKYYTQQRMVDLHRLTYFKTREKIKLRRTSMKDVESK